MSANESQSKDVGPARALQPFHLMAKPGGSSCNLGCAYCFYLEKAQLYPETRNPRMSPQVLEAYIRDYIATQPGQSVSFAWQGGEPTILGLSFFREVIALQQRHAAGKTIENALQSNGVLLDDEWADFLAAHEFLVGISIDGPPELHDAYRSDKGGHPTFDRVLAGLEALKRGGVQFNTLTTVHRRNSQHPLQVYRFLREAGSQFIQFIPIVERVTPTVPADCGRRLAPPPEHFRGDTIDAQVTAWSVRPADYGQFLSMVFDEWVTRDVGKVFVQQFDSALANWLGEPAGVCVFSRTCGRVLVVEHNGDVYGCDHYVYPEYRRGNLLSTPLAAMVDGCDQIQFGAAKTSALPRQCRECPVEFACHGECPKHRFMLTRDGEPGLNYLCAAYRKFFTHIDSPMRTMGALLRSGQPPAVIMRLPRDHWVPRRIQM